ncbi:MAG: hypothetical protein RL357_1358 [Pseudomonadota bacterium]
MIAWQDLPALGAATCWAASTLLSANPAKQLGALRFVRWRMFLVLVLLWPTVMWMGRWNHLDWGTATAMVLSGVVGITLGDSALFAAMNRLGPRRTGVLFATHALFSAGLGFVFLGERLGIQAYAGAILTVTGVMVAVGWGHRSQSVDAWEPQGPMRAGIGLALLAAACQALGALIAKPALTGDGALDPALALAMRVSAAWLALVILQPFPRRGGTPNAPKPLDWRVLKQTAISGWTGMGIGMGLLLWALSLGSVGAVGVLSSVSPVLVLPMLWWVYRRPPAWGAWVGAACAVGGTALMLTR